MTSRNRSFRQPIGFLLLATWGSISAVAAQPTSFAALPYPTRPLTQAGSDNLLPSPGFSQGLKGWDPAGDVRIVDLDGEKVLRLGPKTDNQQSQVRAYAAKPRGGVLYRLRFEVQLPPDDAADAADQPPALNGWLAQRAKGGESGSELKIVESRRGHTWLQREMRLFSQPGADSLYLSLEYDGKSGAALTRRWELIEEPIAAADALRVLETPSGRWAELPHEPQPPTPAQTVLWSPADPDRLSRGLRPHAAELNRPLELAGTPGEMCVAAVAIFCREKLSGVKLALGDLSDRKTKLAVSPTIKQVVFHPRRSEYYGRGMTFHEVADGFVSRPQGTDCPAGETTAFWINLRLPTDAAAGTYTGRLTANSPGAELSLPVRVQVLPFRLAELRNCTRYLALDEGRWNHMSDEQVLAELADVRDHGYESVMLSSHGRLKMESSRVKSFQLEDEAVRNARLALKAGLRGPLMYWGGWLPDRLAADLHLGWGEKRPAADQWPEALTTAMIDTLKLMKSELGKLGIHDPVLVLIDEPGHWKAGSQERLQWDVKTAHAAGWPTFCTSSDPPSDPIGQGLEYHCYGGGRLYVDPQHAAWLARQTHDAGQKFWYYCTGCYSGQVGNLSRNRYLAGFFFARCGADGTLSWTFQRPRGNAFDDFSGEKRGGKRATGQACITYPDAEHPGENIDTLPWEGLRQAFYDQRYVQTLREAIAAARPHDAEAARQAEQRLETLMEQLPWNGDPFLAPGLSNLRLAELRAALASEIQSLTARIAK